MLLLPDYPIKNPLAGKVDLLRLLVLWLLSLGDGSPAPVTPDAGEVIYPALDIPDEELVDRS